ncbi:4609_t:CDS:2 [Gigaspora margarita]|uniref:4609_t:CDS:1 n=1 Tax=Gigaspora margarita TaxID=4874 RepID=A0ABM8VYU8_GIGMA|nr:4609_t:CDS:2 [Gigaspora margarita]
MTDNNNAQNAHSFIKFSNEDSADLEKESRNINMSTIVLGSKDSSDVELDIPNASTPISHDVEVSSDLSTTASKKSSSRQADASLDPKGLWNSLYKKDEKVKELEKLVEHNIETLRANKESEDRLNERVRDLELIKQDLSTQLEDLQQRLNKTLNDYIKNENTLANLTDVIEKLKEERLTLEEYQYEQEFISLDCRINELENLIENKEQKIIHDLSKILKREYIKNVIAIYVEYKKVKKQLVHLEHNKTDKENVLLQNIQKEWLNIKGELKNKLGSVNFNKMENFLIDCGELAGWELERDEKLKYKKQTLQITDGNKDKTILEKYKKTYELQANKRDTAYDKRKKELNNEKMIKLIENANKSIETAPIIICNDNPANETIYIQYNDNVQQLKKLKKELNELEQKSQVLDSTTDELTTNQQEFKNTMLALATKQIFAKIRKETIESLISTYKKINKSGEKFDKLAEFSVELASIVPGVSISAKLIRSGVSLISSTFKNYFDIEHVQKFEDCLINDVKVLTFLQKTFQSLNKSIQDNQSKINFTIIKIFKFNQFDQYDVFKVGGIHKNAILNAEDMQKAIKSLTEHYNKFFEELKKETEQCEHPITQEKLVEKLESIKLGLSEKLDTEDINVLINQR